MNIAQANDDQNDDDKKNTTYQINDGKIMQGAMKSSRAKERKKVVKWK